MTDPPTSHGPFTDFADAPAGAKFIRADLHIHTHGTSKDVTDEGMTPTGLVARALARGIGLLAITDHNSIDAVAEAITEGEKQGLAVLAGVELSTAEGHMLAYFDPADLKGFSAWFGKLDFNEDASTGDRHLLTPLHELAKNIADAGGVAIPAHINRKKNGCLHKAPTKSLDALIASPAISGLEIDGPDEFDFFTHADKADGSSERKARLTARTSALGEVAGPRLPKLYFSDAHTLDEIGRSRDGDERLTRIKLTEPSFAALQRALQDPDARIRLEARLPESYPTLVGARFIGGFLDGREIALSNNLTCLIGGRGAGKSTALEAVRCTCLSLDHERERDEESGWPDTVQLIYRDGFGELHYLERNAGAETSALVGDEAVPMTVPVEGYDQDRIAEIIRGYRKDPTLLQRFLDGFTDLSAVDDRLAEIRDALRANAAEVAPIADAGARRAAAEKALAEAKAKLKKIETSNLKKALEWQRLLAKERTLRASVVTRLRDIQSDVDQIDVDIDTKAMLIEAEISDLSTTPGKELLAGEGGNPGLIAMLDELEEELGRWQKEGRAKVARSHALTSPKIAQWDEYENRIKARIAEIAEELREQGVNPNMAELGRLTAVEAGAKADIKAAIDDLTRIKKLRDARRALIADYKQQQAARYHERSQTTKRLTEQLNESLRSFKVKIAFRQGAQIDAYDSWLRGVMGQRIFRGDRAAVFCRTVRPIDLADIIRKKQTAKLIELKDSAGNPYFSKQADADEFFASVSGERIDELEAIEVSDLPEITLAIPTEDGVRTISFENLSFGQKASILLGALLFSEDDKPLIIDQPEDHLDSAFIFETVVRTLRKVKERRQVILATHNANIAVLGDAELIVPMQEYEGRGRIRDAGSVDLRATSDRACEILEGGKAAYVRRGEMYGFTPAT